MRSEHVTTGDEWDLRTRHLYTRYTRSRAVKWIKTRSHRLDRRNIPNIIREQLDGTD